jgi:hypothetical protein
MCIKVIKLKHYKIAGMSQINYDKKVKEKALTVQINSRQTADFNK